MNDSTPDDIKSTSTLKHPFSVGQNIVVVLDKKIVQELKIREDNTLVQQELTEDGILLRLRRHVQ